MSLVSRPTSTYRKSWPGAPTGFFEAEAAGLRWLAEAEAAGGAKTVAVQAVADDHIDLARVVPGRATPQAAESLGHGLARTHAAGAVAFGAPAPGWSGDAWIGRQSQSNEPTRTWGLFYAEQRVRPFMRRAVDAGHSSSTPCATASRRAPSTTTGRRPVSTETSGRATSSSPTPEPSSSTQQRTAATV